MQLADKYSSENLEQKWYDFWIENNLFHSEPDAREPYCIVIPPPNVTGMLHMGHMLNNTLQDVLVRRARMQGKNACWVPGTDHASIATEAKVVAKLKAEGIEEKLFGATNTLACYSHLILRRVDTKHIYTILHILIDVSIVQAVLHPSWCEDGQAQTVSNVVYGREFVLHWVTAPRLTFTSIDKAIYGPR